MAAKPFVEAAAEAADRATVEPWRADAREAIVPMFLDRVEENIMVGDRSRNIERWVVLFLLLPPDLDLTRVFGRAIAN